jgi:hypothetical protein
VYTQEQKITLLKEQKAYRRSMVKNMVNSSPEKIAHTYIEESLIPSVYSALNELQNQTHLLDTAIQRSSSILQQIFPVKRLKTAALLFQNRPAPVVQENREVLCRVDSKPLSI